MSTDPETPRDPDFRSKSQSPGQVKMAHRYTYDEHGRLIRSQSQPLPVEANSAPGEPFCTTAFDEHGRITSMIRREPATP
jgi:hypothetical protein